ncbi:hypothetical protein T11_7401 [Trichinella zimbabwensis]|uniref:Uncharacterized protein n=1 Tax=Trichinella zimbabwensis TaxID=268475 RepID=A0A0V1HTI6_9BILA|nr:hypothetical protein T11_7401 [Trichinella zimbabwensis]
MEVALESSEHTERNRKELGSRSEVSKNITAPGGVLKFIYLPKQIALTNNWQCEAGASDRGKTAECDNAVIETSGCGNRSKSQVQTDHNINDNNDNNNNNNNNNQAGHYFIALLSRPCLWTVIGKVIQSSLKSTVVICHDIFKAIVRIQMIHYLISD